MKSRHFLFLLTIFLAVRYKSAPFLWEHVVIETSSSLPSSPSASLPMDRPMPARAFSAAWPSLIFSACVLVSLTSGCTSMKTTNTARSSTEQMLVSNAVDQALDKIDFRPFSGRSVYLEEKYVDCVDKAYVVSSIRHRVLHSGARLVDKADDADVVLEPRAGAVGTSNSETFLGIPEITLPGMLTLPEIRIATRSQQVGVAKIGVAAFDPKSRESLGAGGMTLAKSDDTNLSVFGVGPFQSGTIRNEVNRSTSGPAAFSQPALPVQVAFRTPPPSVPAADPPAEIEFTSAEPVQEATTAEEETPEGDAPNWSRE